MLFKTYLKIETLIAPLTFSRHNVFPYNFIAARIQDYDKTEHPVFFSAVEHDAQTRSFLVQVGDMAYIQLKGCILDVEAYVSELQKLSEQVGASRMIMVLAVPTALKTCPEQHMQTQCVRYIGDYFADVKYMENVSSVSEWLGAFGPQFEALQRIAPRDKVGAVISFETMAL